MELVRLWVAKEHGTLTMIKTLISAEESFERGELVSHASKFVRVGSGFLHTSEKISMKQEML